MCQALLLSRSVVGGQIFGILLSAKAPVAETVVVYYHFSFPGVVLHLRKDVQGT